MRDAWEMVVRGLRRIFERCARVGEWGDEGRDLGLLLRYLIDHLQDHEPPEEVIEALLDLRRQLDVPEDRIDLGKCLSRLRFVDDARVEIVAGLGEELEPDYRDEGIRALLSMDVKDFDRRLAKATDDMAMADDPSPAVAEMERFLELQPGFWPALYLKAMGDKRLGRDESALDCLADVLRICPGQPDALFEMAELFESRGNPKRALECVEHAVENRPDDSQLYAAMTRYLMGLGRIDEANAAVGNALSLAPNDREIRALHKRLGRM